MQVDRFVSLINNILNLFLFCYLIGGRETTAMPTIRFIRKKRSTHPKSLIHIVMFYIQL